MTERLLGKNFCCWNVNEIWDMGVWIWFLPQERIDLSSNDFEEINLSIKNNVKNKNINLCADTRQSSVILMENAAVLDRAQYHSSVFAIEIKVCNHFSGIDDRINLLENTAKVGVSAIYWTTLVDGISTC